MKAENFPSQIRKSILYAVIIIGFSFLLIRLFQMQILQKGYYELKSKRNSVKKIEKIPVRGLFLDRNKKLLVNNLPSYTIFITKEGYDKNQNKLLEATMGLEDGYINKFLEKNKRYSKYLQLRFKRGVSFNTISWIEENMEHLPGISYKVEMHRGYPANVTGAQMFGYLNEISQKQLNKFQKKYKLGDFIGSTGLEKKYENLLRGKKGYNYLLVDSRRKFIGKFKDGKNDMPAVKGNDLILTIDSELQRVAEESLRGKRGAIVAIEPKTGDVLAMVSAPDYDLSKFAYLTTEDYLQKLHKDPAKPFFNRAIMSVKPPGSTFKILEAIAALDLGVINKNTTFYCSGGGKFYGRYFKCDGVHGRMNVIQAIERSCNVFYYNLIYKIGMKKWKEYATLFGFSKKTGIDLSNEAKGLIPDEQYYIKRYGKNWPKSIMASLAIGQGEVSVDPIQLALFTAIVANNGNSFRPHLLKGYIDERTNKFVKVNPKPIHINIKKEVWDIVKKGMFLVVNGKGTAVASRIPNIFMAGKTGTAQNPHGDDHALFIGFAPFDNPQIAFSIIVENVGFGASHAAPIAKKLVETYLLRKMNKNVAATNLSVNKNLVK
ncbi:MAG: penicillin-binding protein 2 [Bacteroidetes bacterium]|nr:penicillin-binding protein 2 [Bacteroidota bacterium]